VSAVEREVGLGVLAAVGQHAELAEVALAASGWMLRGKVALAPASSRASAGRRSRGQLRPPRRSTAG